MCLCEGEVSYAFTNVLQLPLAIAACNASAMTFANQLKVRMYMCSFCDISNILTSMGMMVW